MADAKLRDWAATYSMLVKGMGSHRPEDVATQTGWARAVDERMLIPVVGLVRRSFAYPKQLDPRALFWVIAALGRLGPSSPHREIALKTLLDAPMMKLYDARSVEVVRALAAFDDPRVGPWLETVTKSARAGRFADSEAVFGAALDVLAARSPEKASSIVADVLSKSDRHAHTLHAGAARVAGTHALAKTFDALAKALPAAEELRRATIGRALATMNAKKATPLLVRELGRAADPTATGSDGVELRFEKKSYRLWKSVAATFLPGLLALDPKNESLSSVAKSIRRSSEYWAEYLDA